MGNLVKRTKDWIKSHRSPLKVIKQLSCSHEFKHTGQRFVLHESGNHILRDFSTCIKNCGKEKIFYIR